MSNVYNTSLVTVNPLLNTFPADEINIQPYWIVVVELIALQFCQRIWHHFKFNTWFTTLEIAGLIRIFQKNPTDVDGIERPVSSDSQTNASTTSGTSQRDANITADKVRLAKLRNMIAIDYFDAINCILICAHAIWYCVIQSTCMRSSSSAATPWNCYNAFGYRLFNYIFVSYCTTTLNCVYKGYMQGYMRVIRTKAKRGSFCWLIHYASLITIVMTLVFVTCLLLPFLLTHIVPMFFIYIWMSIIYISVGSYLVFSGFMAHDEIIEITEEIDERKYPQRENSDREECCSFMFSKKELPNVALSIVLALLITTFPILLAIFFNYTQYFYYDAGYLNSIENDYNARGTNQYFQELQNSGKQVLHSVLNFL